VENHLNTNDCGTGQISSGLKQILDPSLLSHPPKYKVPDTIQTDAPEVEDGRFCLPSTLHDKTGMETVENHQDTNDYDTETERMSSGENIKQIPKPSPVSHPPQHNILHTIGTDAPEVENGRFCLTSTLYDKTETEIIMKEKGLESFTPGGMEEYPVPLTIVADPEFENSGVSVSSTLCDASSKIQPLKPENQIEIGLEKVKPMENLDLESRAPSESEENPEDTSGADVPEVENSGLCVSLILCDATSEIHFLPNNTGQETLIEDQEERSTMVKLRDGTSEIRLVKDDEVQIQLEKLSLESFTPGGMKEHSFTIAADAPQFENSRLCLSMTSTLCNSSSKIQHIKPENQIQTGLEKVRAMEKLDFELESLNPNELEEFIRIHGADFNPKWVAVTLEMIKTSKLLTTRDEDMKQLIRIF